jgi:HlyD family secretion protein
VKALAFVVPLGLVTITAPACGPQAPRDRIRVSGHVEATEVRVAAEVGGPVVEVRVAEGDRVQDGAVVVRLDSHDAELALARARAERSQADAQLRLLQAGARTEDVRVAEAQRTAAEAEVSVAAAERAAAEVEVDRFERLLASRSGTRKQRDDAVARLNVAKERERAAQERLRSSVETVARVKAGPRREELDAALARIEAADQQIAMWEKAVTDATVYAPIGGIVTTKIVNVGELAQRGQPLVVIADLDHAWANVFVDEPLVPRLRIGQTVTLFTDAGGPGRPGTVSYISPQAEFTPRNVQTAEDRAKLVYRVKVSADNSDGLLKIGMPVEAEIPVAVN